MGRISRKLGTVKSELIIIDPNLISIRLEDGSFIGGEIIEFDDGKYHLAPGQKPVEYTSETINRILKHGWNVRSDYGDIEALADKIAAAGNLDTGKVANSRRCQQPNNFNQRQVTKCVNFPC